MGFLLLFPFFLVRFGLLSRLNKDSVKRAAYFAPLAENEKPAYWIYQLSNMAVFICIIFCRIRLVPGWLFFIGAAVYAAGILFLIFSVVSFAAPSENGINLNGIYRMSRNPMYVAYFVFFTGCSLLAQSSVLFVLVLAFQISSHWIILSEERWCIQKFGEEYRQYMGRVRRYL